MENKVILEVIGTQHYDKSNNDKVELTTVGAFEEADDKYIIRYTEEQEPPARPVRTKLSIFKDRHQVEILRSGDTGSCLIIERSKRNLCRYGTEYGEILMGIYGRSVEARLGENEGEFSFAYDIDANGALTSQNEVTVKYRKIGEQECRN